MKLTVAEIAKVAHNVNRAYCQSIGDHSLSDWDHSPHWQKESIENGVMNVLAKPDTTPEESHRNWLMEKEREGWTYGVNKDVDRKKHPCMLAYYDLPKEQRLKDSLFLAVVKTLMEV